MTMPAALELHLPILAVMLPLTAAILCFLVMERPNAPFWIALLATLGTGAMSILLCMEVSDGSTLSYALGGWAPPLGIAYRVDMFTALLLLIVSGTGGLVFVFARASIAHEIAPDIRGYFYVCALLCLSGLLGVVMTADAFNLFVFLEISSLSAYALIALAGGRDRRALVAAFNYLIMGTIGATFFVLGVGFLYAATGTLNMNDLAERLPPIQDLTTVRAGFAFVFVGLALKIALFPLHLWLPDAYTHAPSAVSAFLSATASKVAVYALLRFFFSVFGVDFTFEAVLLEFLILPLAMAGMIAASLAALFQRNLKRMLAYSSIAQIGYIMLGIGLETHLGVEAALLHLFNHALMKGALFMAAGCVIWRIGSVSIGDVRGLGRAMPWTMGAFTLAGLSLIGVPLTAGFVSKWALLQAALDKDAWLVVAAIVATSILAAVYIGRFLETIWLPLSARDSAPMREAPLSMLLPLWIFALANIYFGIDTRLPLHAAHIAAQNLGVSP